MIFEFFMLLLQAEMRIKKLDIFMLEAIRTAFRGNILHLQFIADDAVPVEIHRRTDR